MGYDLQNN